MNLRILVAACLLVTASAFGQGSGSVAVVPNIAALATRQPSAVAPVVSVAGYRTNGDWGSARTMRYVPTSTATVDNGCVFATATGTGRWEADDCDTFVDPRWFDIHPTNSASLNSSNWVNLGERAYSIAWPRGRFTFDRPIRLTNALALNWLAPNGSYQGGYISTNSVNETELAYTGPGTNIFVNLLVGMDGTGTNQMLRYGHQMVGISVNANRLADVALAIGHVGRMELTRVRYNGAVGTNGYFEQIQFTKMQSCSTSKNDETPSVTLPSRVGMSLSMDTRGIFSAASSIEDCVWESSSEWALVLGPKAKNITITSGAIESNDGNGVAILDGSSGITMIGTWFENNGGATNLWIEHGAYFNTFVGLRMSEDYTAYTYIDGGYNTFVGCLFGFGTLSYNGVRNKFINCTYSDGWEDQTAGGNSYFDLINSAATVRTNTLSSPYVMYGEPFTLWNGTNIYPRVSLRYNGIFLGDGSNPEDSGLFRLSGASLGTSNTIVMLAQGANSGLLTGYTPESAYPNVALNVNGTLAWGFGGTNLADVEITHAATNELRLNGQWIVLRTNAALLGFAVGMTNDAFARVGMTSRGLEFGGGSGPRTAGITYDSPYTVLLNSNVTVSGRITLGGVSRSSWPSDADTLDGQDGSWYLSRANHSGTQSYTTVTGLGGLATVNDAPSDGSTYGRLNGAWTSVAGSGGGLGTNAFVNGVLRQPFRLTNDLAASGGVVFITNGAGDVTAYATNLPAAGSGQGTNAFVNGVLRQPFRLTNDLAATGGVVFLTNGAGDVTAYATNLPSGTGGGGDVYRASNNVFTASNQMPILTVTTQANVGTLHAVNLILDSPLGLANGGTDGTNAESARSSLGVTYDVDVQAFRLGLLQSALALTSSGHMIYHNGSLVTNVTSTSPGRYLLTAASATDQRNALVVGELSQDAYGAGRNGETNKTPTWDAVYDAINALPGGSNAITTWNTNYFSVSGGYLDWVGGATGVGGGGAWEYIYTNAAGAWQDRSGGTNWTVISTSISSNKVPTAVGHFLDGGWSLMFSNYSGTTATVFLDVSVGGTQVFRDSYTSSSAATAMRAMVGQFNLLRESSSTAALWMMGQNANSSSTPIGQGDFGNNVSSATVIATNIPVTWSSNVQFSVVLSCDTAVATNTALGIAVAHAYIRSPVTSTNGVSDGDKGDITVTASGATWTIDADAVALGTDTTGNYVASVSGTANEVSASGSGEAAAVTLSLPATIDLGGKTSFELPNGSTPTVDAFGEIAGDDNAWATGRGAVVAYDGTSETRLLGVLSSDTPSNGQVPKWNTGGTITWEDDTSGSGGSSTNILVNTNLVTQANLINSDTILLSVDGSKIQAHLTNNLVAGAYGHGFLPLHAGVSNMITGDLFRKQGTDIREPMWEDGTEWNAVGLRANGGKLSFAEFNTNDWTVLEEFVVIDPTDPTDDVITFGNSGFNNKVIFDADVEFNGTASFESMSVGTLTITNPIPARGITNSTASRFAVFGADYRLTNDVAATGTGAPVRAVDPALTGTPTINATNVMAAIDGKQPLDADLTALAAGTAMATAMTNAVSVGAPILYVGTTNVAAALAAAGGGGSVATDAIFTTKGDLAVGTGSSTASRLGVGSDGLSPIADSTEATGIKWGSPSGLGTIRHFYRYSDFEPDTAVGTFDVAAPWKGGALSGGSAALSAVEGLTNHWGVARISSVTTSNSGWKYVLTQYGMQLAGQGESAWHAWRPVSTNNGIINKLGFLDSITTTESVDCAAFMRTNNLISGVTRSNNVQWATASAYTIASNAWYYAQVLLPSQNVVRFNLYSESWSLVWSDSITNGTPHGRTLGHGYVGFATNAVGVVLDDIDFFSVEKPNAR